MTLTMLGTGYAMVTEIYNTCFVIEDEGRCFLTDAGGGNQILGNLKKAGIPILYHTEEENIASRKELYAKEAEEVFRGNVYVPQDFEKIEI